MTETGDSTRRRRLAAILMADVVGFSKMMERDEEGTTSLILEFHAQVRETVEQHGGRVVGTAGDSVFGDFDSIVEALDCATEIQRHLHAENAAIPPEERLEARIGLHLGDVLVEEYNVFGDGVNIAARLEQLADPGGIVLSEAVYQQVKARSDLPFEKMGTRTLKNIDQSIRLYRIGPDAFGGDPAERSPAKRKRSEARSETGQVIRDAIEKIVDKVESEIDESQGEGRLGSEDIVINVLDDELANGDRVVVAFNPGTFSIAAIGVLGILARTSGWTDNAWYPFIGAWFLGVAVGRLLQAMSGRRGVAHLMNAIGIGVGAFFFDNEVMRAILLVAAAGMFGSAIQRLRKR